MHTLFYRIFAAEEDFKMLMKICFFSKISVRCCSNESLWRTARQSEIAACSSAALKNAIIAKLRTTRAAFFIRSSQHAKLGSNVNGALELQNRIDDGLVLGGDFFRAVSYNQTLTTTAAATQFAANEESDRIFWKFLKRKSKQNFEARICR